MPTRRHSSKPSGNGASGATTRGDGFSSPVLTGTGTTKPGSSRERKRCIGLHQWKNPKIFSAYLQSVKSAASFMTEGGVHFLRSLKGQRKKRLYAHLKAVDPEGFAKLKSYRIGVMNRVRREIKRPGLIKRLAEEAKLIVAQQHFDTEAIVKVRFVQERSIRKVLASMLAAGYSRQETADLLEMEIELVNSIREDEITEIKSLIPKMIIQAADQKVFKDLISDKVDENTERVDRIVARRRKLVLDALGAGKKSTDPVVRQEAETKYRSLFGVERAINARKVTHGEETEDGTSPS